MAIGFMIGRFEGRCTEVARFGDLTRALLCCLSFGALAAHATDVGLAGVFPGKALISIDGGAPRTVAVGVRTEEGVKVLAVDADGATIEVNGRKRVLRVGQNVTAQGPGNASASAVLTADAAGHFVTTGVINGRSVRFLVDTGASFVSLGAGDAQRIGVDARRGEPAVVNTANGQANVWRVKLDSVRVGDIVLNNVDGLVHQQDMPMVLLGMSFLNRMEMQRDGQTMTLKQRY